MSDHHVFRVHERPYLFMSCGRWRHCHAPSDTPEKLNYTKMQALCSYLVALSSRIVGTPLMGPFEGYDSTPAELALLRSSLGSMAATLGLQLATRQDIDRVANVFLGQLRS